MSLALEVPTDEDRSRPAAVGIGVRHKVLIAAAVAAAIGKPARIRGIRRLPDPSAADATRQGRVRIESARVAARQRIKIRLRPVRERKKRETANLA